MAQDFEKLDRNINIGSFIVVFLASIIIALMIMFIITLNDEIDSLNSDIKDRDKIIVEINKKSYNRFKIASDLTTICDKFKSSREAKEKYYIYGTL